MIMGTAISFLPPLFRMTVTVLCIIVRVCFALLARFCPSRRIVLFASIDSSDIGNCSVAYMLALDITCISILTPEPLLLPAPHLSLSYHLCISSTDFSYQNQHFSESRILFHQTSSPMISFHHPLSLLSIPTRD